MAGGDEKKTEKMTKKVSKSLLRGDNKFGEANHNE